jgi:hypothetical protein
MEPVSSREAALAKRIGPARTAGLIQIKQLSAVSGVIAPWALREPSYD